MANLPLKRMESTPPFMYSGMDYFRPFYVKEVMKGLKKYRFIFIHREVLDNLTAASFQNVLRCFIAI